MGCTGSKHGKPESPVETKYVDSVLPTIRETDDEHTFFTADGPEDHTEVFFF